MKKRFPEWLSVLLGANISVPKDSSIQKIRRRVIAIALPALAELMFIQLATIVDNAMVGRLGNWALAAVGYSAQPLMLLLTVISAMHTGSTALIARYKGAKDSASANRTMGMTLSLSLLLSLCFMTVGMIFARQLVILMGASGEETIEAAASYFQIRLIGMPIQAVMLACSSSFRGVGRTRVTMIYNGLGNAFNIVANYALIYGAWGFPKLGVQGAAWATNIGMSLAMSIALIFLIRGSDILKLRFKWLFSFSKNILRNISLVGTPAMIEHLFLRLGLLIYMRLVAFGGQDMYAAHIITQNIMVLTFSNGQAFGIAATTLTGQGVGSDRLDLSEAAVRLSNRYCMYVSTLLIIVFTTMGRLIAGLYTVDQTTIDLVGRMLIIVAIIQPLMGMQLCLAGALRGAGDAKKVTKYSAIGILIIRPICCGLFMFLIPMGLAGAWYAYFVDQCFRSVYTLRYYLSGKWREGAKRLTQKTVKE